MFNSPSHSRGSIQKQEDFEPLLTSPERPGEGQTVRLTEGRSTKIVSKRIDHREDLARAGYMSRMRTGESLTLEPVIYGPSGDASE
jgi:hypothetical protein